MVPLYRFSPSFFSQLCSFLKCLMKVLQTGCIRAGLGILEQTAEPLGKWKELLDRIAERGMGIMGGFGDFQRTNCQILK